MYEQQTWRIRLGLLTELVARAPVKLGRTAVMKIANFLQTAKDVPLGYHFRLYTHGPFDGDVLNDLEQACAIGAVKSEMITFASASWQRFPRVPRLASRSSHSAAGNAFLPFRAWQRVSQIPGNCAGVASTASAQRATTARGYMRAGRDSRHGSKRGSAGSVDATKCH